VVAGSLRDDKMIPKMGCNHQPRRGARSMTANSAASPGALAGYRVMLRPQPGFYVLRFRRGAPLVAALIYQFCPMVVPQPTALDGPHPDDWCRPLDRSRCYGAQIDGKRADLERIWFIRSLRPISRDEFEFRSGPLRRWARQNPSAPEARPHRQVDLDAIPPLF
jgi:hypothetical protein